MALQKKKTQAFIDELNAMDLNMEYTNKFGWNSRLRAIKKEAENLLGSDVIKASIILGMIECLLHNDLEMRARHTNAINNAPNYAPGYYNFAQSLRKAALYEEAVDHYEKALSLDPSHSEWYIAASKNYLSLCRWDLAFETMLRQKRLNETMAENIEMQLRSLKNALDEYGIDATKIASLKKVADNFLRTKNLQSTTEVDFKRFTNDGDFIYWPIFVRANKETIKQLNYEFSDVLAESSNEIYADKLVFSFVEAT